MQFDVVVIGGGHNGLSCARKLAAEGLKVGVFERSNMLGGAARTEELWPGYRVSSFSYVLSLMPQAIIKEFELESYGLRMFNMDPSMVQPFPEGRLLTLWRDPLKTLDEIAKFSKKDAETAVDYYREWDKFFNVFDRHLLTPEPPRIGELEDELYRTGLAHLVPTMLYGSVGRFLDENFEAKEVKAALSAEAIIGTHAGPYSPGNMANMILHSMGMSTGARGAWAYVEGGMGSVSMAIARSAEAKGATIVTGNPVSEVIVRNGRAAGVKLSDGRVVESRVVVSNADIKTSLLDLVDRDALEQIVRSRVAGLSSNGVSMKVHLALESLPHFRKGIEGSLASSSIIHIGPSLEYLEKAYDESKYGTPSGKPFVSLEFPTVYDTTLAPAGKHIATMFVQYAPYHSKRNWDDMKEEYTKKVLDTVEEYVPDIRSKILNTHTYTPKDIEKVVGIKEGNIHHIDLTLDQAFGNRPLPGWGYTTPITGYYLCGASTYPGGGVSGVCGYNSATKIIADIRQGRV
jgi:phytoene dehydrogenase-like protein